MKSVPCQKKTILHKNVFIRIYKFSITKLSEERYAVELDNISDGKEDIPKDSSEYQYAVGVSGFSSRVVLDISKKNSFVILGVELYAIEIETVAKSKHNYFKIWKKLEVDHWKFKGKRVHK